MIHHEAQLQDGWAGNWLSREMDDRRKESCTDYLCVYRFNEVPVTAVLHTEERECEKGPWQCAVPDSLLLNHILYYRLFTFFGFSYSEIRHTHKVTHSHTQSRTHGASCDFRELGRSNRISNDMKIRKRNRLWKCFLSDSPLSWSRWSKPESWSRVSPYWLNITH